MITCGINYDRLIEDEFNQMEDFINRHDLVAGEIYLLNFSLKNFKIARHHSPQIDPVT
jgi:hypothetical protein